MTAPVPSRPEDAFARVLAARGDRPLVGWYDDAAGARMELSARSAATWVAKTAWLLTDELGLGPGDAVRVALPPHWVVVPVLAGVWAAGCEVVPTAPGVRAGAGGRVAVAIVTQADAAAHAADADEVFAVDPASPWQLGGADTAAARDLALALRPHADRLPPAGPAGPDDPALAGRSRRDVVAAAQDRAAAAGWPERPSPPRLGWAGRLETAADVEAAVVAPWLAGGSLVLLAGVAPARRDTVAATEQITDRLDGSGP